MLGTDGGSWASRSTIYWEKAFTCVLSWAYQNLASSQFGQGNSRCPRDVFYTHPLIFGIFTLLLIKVYVPGVGELYTYRRGLLRCSFYQTGQCESLDKRDE